MTDWVTLTSDELGSDKIFTSPTATALYENVLAAFEKALGAPQLAALYVVTAMLDDLAVSEAKLAAAAVSQSKCKTATGSAGSSINPGSNDQILLNPYCFFPMIHATSQLVWVGGHGTDAANPDAPRLLLHNSSGSNQNWDVDWRYIASSPPYDLGDGQVAGFIYAVPGASGEVSGIWAAPDPPWGPRLGSVVVDRDGRAWRMVRRSAFDLEDVKAGRCSIEGLVRARREATWDRVEIAKASKLEGMDKAPHPFPGSAGPVVLIDPMEGLAELLLDHDGGAREVTALRHHLVIDNEPLERAAPPGVQVCRARLRNMGSAR